VRTEAATLLAASALVDAQIESGALIGLPGR
jgi:hypothetical protein